MAAMLPCRVRAWSPRGGFRRRRRRRSPGRSIQEAQQAEQSEEHHRGSPARRGAEDPDHTVWVGLAHAEPLGLPLGLAVTGPVTSLASVDVTHG